MLGLRAFVEELHESWRWHAVHQMSVHGSRSSLWGCKDHLSLGVFWLFHAVRQTCPLLGMGAYMHACALS